MEGARAEGSATSSEDGLLAEDEGVRLLGLRQLGEGAGHEVAVEAVVVALDPDGAVAAHRDGAADGLIGVVGHGSERYCQRDLPGVPFTFSLVMSCAKPRRSRDARGRNRPRTETCARTHDGRGRALRPTWNR